MKKANKIMKSKKNIKEELNKKLGIQISDKIWNEAHTKLNNLYLKYDNLPAGVAKHTDSFIFPIAAIYLSIKEEAPEKAFEIMEYTMKEKSSATGKSLTKMVSIPGFKKLFIKMWHKMSHSMFGEAAGFKNTFYPCQKGEFKMDILECPYNKYLTELGCPEITILFCNNDIYTYGNIPGLKFTRTKTIGAGDDLCDFKMEIQK